MKIPDHYKVTIVKIDNSKFPTLGRAVTVKINVGGVDAPREYRLFEGDTLAIPLEIL